MKFKVEYIKKLDLSKCVIIDDEVLINISDLPGTMSAEDWDKWLHFAIMRDNEVYGPIYLIRIPYGEVKLIN